MQFKYKCTKCDKDEEVVFKLSKKLEAEYICKPCRPKRDIECPGINIPDSFTATKDFGE